MKSIILGIPQTFFHPILIFTAAVMLAALGIVMPPAHGNGQQEKERSVQIKIYKNEPVEIVAVKVKDAPVKIGQKFAGDSDWFNGMVVTIKNISNKPVTFATVFVMAPYEKNGVRKQVNGRDLYANIELIYGEPPPMPGKRRSNPIALLMPGETTDVLLDEGWRDQFYFRLRLEDSSTDIPELTLSTFQVAFLGDDDTMWMHGFWRRRDPKDPGSWLTVDDPPQMNHAAGIPRFLRDTTPGVNLGGRPYHMLDPLPRCIHRDIGDVLTNCDACDIGGGLHCKWKNDTFLTSGVKNAVLRSPTVKFCEGSDSEHACAAIETHSDTLGDHNCTSPIAGLCGGEPDFGTYPSTGCATGFVYTESPWPRNFTL